MGEVTSDIGEVTSDIGEVTFLGVAFLAFLFSA